jgi:UDP-N-acetylmuramyl pentapeptide synthase
MPAAVALAALWPEQAGLPDVAITGLVLDHRQLKAGQVYVALQGRLPLVQMQQFATEALQQGAALVLTELPLTGAGGAQAA